jgi:hypothetical protein
MSLARWKDLWDNKTKDYEEREWRRQGYRKICAPELWYVTILLFEAENSETLSIPPVATKIVPESEDMSAIHELLQGLNELCI